MSIQSSINQALALGAGLATQSPEYKANVEKKIETKEIKKEKAAAAEEYLQTSAMVNKEIEDLNSTKQSLPDKGAEEVKEEIKQKEETLSAIKEGAEKRARTAAENLALREGRLSNDYSRYLELKKEDAYQKARRDAEQALRDAQEQKRARRRELYAQKKEAFLDQPTSLGGTVRDLPENIRRRLMRNV